MNRRNFLRGTSGAFVALPFIGALTPRESWGQASAKTNTFIMRNGNGVAQAWSGTNGERQLPAEPERFWPRSLGALDLKGKDKDRAVGELAAYQDKTLIVTGTKHPFHHHQCGHAKGLAQSLTAAQFEQHGAGRNTVALGRSLDWEIAARINPKGAAPLNLRSGVLYSGPDSAESQTATYSAARTKVDGESNPYAVYKRLFGLGNVDASTQQKLARRRLSVNDLVRGQMNALLGKATLGNADRSRLRKHFEAIRDLEVKMTATLSTDQVSAMEDIAANAGQNDLRLKVAEMQIDIAALAFATDQNRVATLQIGGIGDGTRYRVNGQLVPDFHWISHRIADNDTGPTIPDADKLHHAIDRLFLQTFRHMLDWRTEYDILDESTCYWTNDLAHGWTHAGDLDSRQPLPQVIVSGRMRGNRYVDAGGVTHNRLLSTILAASGARTSSGGYIDFGDASLPKGVMAELLP